MMDWYFGHEAGELVVPKEQEYVDRLPSPDSWSWWGACVSGNTCLRNNFDAAEISNPPDGKSQQQMLFGKGGKEINQADEMELSCSSSNVEGSAVDSDPGNAAACGCGRADVYFNNLPGTDAMDDMFLSTLLQDDVPVAANNHGQFPFSQHCPNSTTPPDSDFLNKMLDCCSVQSANESVGTLKYFTSPPFSPSHGSDSGPVSLSNLSYGNYSDQSRGPSAKISGVLRTELDASMRSDEEDSGIEESVLMDLETVLGQLSNKSRLCVRDSLYRLARNSEDHMAKESRVDELPLHESGTSRSGKIEAAESESNTMDRVVASLMFNEVNVNVQDILPAMAAKFEHLGKYYQGVGDSNHGLNQEDALLASEQSDGLAQSEVPVFDHQNLLPMQT